MKAKNMFIIILSLPYSKPAPHKFKGEEESMLANHSEDIYKAEQTSNTYFHSFHMIAWSILYQIP